MEMISRERNKYLRHINAKHVAQQRLTDVQTQPTQKYSHERNPAAVLQQGAQQAFLAETPAHDGESDVAEAGEDGEETEVGGEAGAIVGVEPAAVPSCKRLGLVVLGGMRWQSSVEQG